MKVRDCREKLIGTPGGTRCVRYMQLCNGKMVSPRPHEETSSAGDTVVSQTTDVGFGIISTVSTAYNGPILTLRHPRMPTSPPTGMSGKYMPSFTVPMRRTLGMPTEFMESMHNPVIYWVLSMSI